MRTDLQVMAYRFVDSQKFTVATATRCIQAYLRGDKNEGDRLLDRFNKYYKDFQSLNGFHLDWYPELKRNVLLTKDVLDTVLKGRRKQDTENAIKQLELINRNISKFYKKLGESGTGAI